MGSERSLNALEDLFASCNVRFAALLVLDRGEEVALERANAACACRLGHLALSKGCDGWKLLTNPTPTAAICDKLVDLEDFGRFLDEAMAETVPAEGPMHVRLIPYRIQPGDRSQGVMIYVNSNHAICDGRSLVHFLGVASTADRLKSWPLEPLPDWKELIAEAKLEMWHEDPPFLTSKNPILSMKELCLEHNSKGAECLRFNLSGTSLKSLRRQLKKAAEGATLTGFLIALLMHCLAAQYSGSEARDVGISVLVDLRGYLPDAKSISEQQLPQAHGTVTVIDSIDATSVDENISVRIKKIWEKATEMTRQLHDRVMRGEAHRSALAVTQGRFDEGPPEATIELSNLGVCPMPEGARLYTGQRFDGYNGVSCMVHTDGNEEGWMRWSVSVGEGLDSKMLRRIFEGAFDLWKLMEADSSPCRSSADAPSAHEKTG